MSAPILCTPLDNRQTTVAAPYTPGSGTLTVVDGSVFGSPSPSSPVRASVFRAPSKNARTHLKITGRSGNVLTVAVTDGFTDVSLQAGDTVGVRVSADTIKEIQSSLNTLWDAGTQGPQGPQGVAGNQGVAGSNGTQGNSGATGNQGNQGVPGERGFQGYQGVIGNTGATGNQGVPGQQGNTGSNGNQGERGFQGYQGYQGYQGVVGTGTQGSQGPQGAAGSGGDFDGYLTTDEDELVLEQTGDEFGTTRLRLQNRTGSNGALFEQAGMYDLIDFAFKAGSYQSTIRLETRGGNIFAGYPEFQFNNPDDPTIVISPNGSVSRKRFAVDDKGGGSIDTSAWLFVKNKNAGEIAVSIRAASGQTGNLTDWQNSSGSTIAYVSASGVFNGNGSGLTDLNASNLSSGTVGTARLGSGTADNTKFLRGDSTWADGPQGPQGPQGSVSPTAVNIATITTSLTLTSSDATSQMLTASGADRVVVLPTSPPTGLFFLIKNVGSSNNLSIKDSGGVSVGQLVPWGCSMSVIWSGSAWEVY